MSKLTDTTWGEYNRECLEHAVPLHGKISDYTQQLEIKLRKAEKLIEEQRKMLVRAEQHLARFKR